MLYIVLPAYNEALALPELISDIEVVCKNMVHRIVLVNDGSSDHTQTVADDLALQKPVLHVVNHAYNQGLGAALLTGFKEVLSLQRLNIDDVVNVNANLNQTEPAVVITMDSDNTHPADRIPLLLESIREGADLVIASRYVEGGQQIGLRALRKFLSRCAGLIMGVIFPIPGVKDYSCGYRAYRVSVLEKGFRLYGERLIESKSFAAMVEILIKLAPLCAKVGEVPLILHYERKSGQSKMKVFKTIWGYFKLIYYLKWETRGSMVWIPEKQ